MGSINAQIDAAVVEMKKRAAEFDETKSMDGTNAIRLVGEAERDVHSARAKLVNAEASNPRRTRLDLIDAMNRCALALSLLPSDAELEARDE